MAPPQHKIDCFASFLNTFPDETFVCQVFYHTFKKKNHENIHCALSLKIQKWEHHQWVKKIQRDVLILSKIPHVHAQSLQSCLTLCNPMDYSPPDSSVHGILQARILQWVAMPSSRGLVPTQGYQTCNSHAADGFFTTEALGKPLRYHVHEADFTRSFESLTK